MANVNLESIIKGEKFYIAKKSDPTPMQAFLVDGPEDIPETLKGSVLFVESMDDIPKDIKTNIRTDKDGSAYRLVPEYGTNNLLKEDVVFPQVLTQAAENQGIYMACDSHMLIKYEPTDNLPSGVGTWPKTNWADTTYQDENGGWHNKASVLPAALITETLPSFAEGGHVTRIKDGIEIQTSWGSTSAAKLGEGYLICYNEGAEDAAPDLNILTHTEESMNSYDVCTADGVVLMDMKEMDEARVALEREKRAEEIKDKMVALEGLAEDKGLSLGDAADDAAEYE